MAKRNRRQQRPSLRTLWALPWKVAGWPKALGRRFQRNNTRRHKTDEGAPTEPETTSPAGRLLARRIGSAMVTLLMWGIPAGLAAAAFTSPLLGVRAYDYVMETGHFHVRDVLVDGNERLDFATIKQLAGLKPGTHLLAADLMKMQRQLEDHPWVSRAVIRKELPDRLVITLSEHRPVGFLESEGRLLLVNEVGNPFAPLEIGEMFDFPILTGIDLALWEKPAQAAWARSSIRRALNVSRLYRSMDLHKRWPISEIRIHPDRRMTLVISPHGTEAVLGRGPYKRKLYRLEWVLENLRQQSKIADYVLLDSERGGSDDGRVIVRAELAPKASELRKEARAFAEETEVSAEGKKNTQKQGEKRAKPGKPTDKQSAEIPAHQEGLLPRMRRQQRRTQLKQHRAPVTPASQPGTGGHGEE